MAPEALEENKLKGLLERVALFLLEERGEDGEYSHITTLSSRFLRRSSLGCIVS